MDILSFTILILLIIILGLMLIQFVITLINNHYLNFGNIKNCGCVNKCYHQNAPKTTSCTSCPPKKNNCGCK